MSWLRGWLSEHDVTYDKDEKSIALLEKALRARSVLAEDARLEGLRSVQEIRSRVGAHVPGTRADELARDALAEHATYAEHFRAICLDVVAELRLVEETLE